MRSIKNWLNIQGYSYNTVTLTSGCQGLMIDIDYTGPHPGKEALAKIGELNNKVKRYKRLAGEPRGHYTGYLIKEIAK